MADKLPKIPANRRPTLLGRIEGLSNVPNAVAAVPGEDAVITVSDDKTLRVWVKRDNGQYWPSIVQSFDSATSALIRHSQDDGNHQVFVGLGSGQIMEYQLSKDLNRFQKKRTYSIHSGRVTSMKYIHRHDWLLSVSRDKRFVWACTSTGRTLGSYEGSGWCLAVEYDETNRYGFAADYGGGIHVLKLEEGNFHHVTTLRGHTSSVWALCYDIDKRVLFSAGFDQTIVVWDIGTQEGNAYELSGHSNKVRGLCYSSHTRKLVSISDDGLMGVWDMDAPREETVEWAHGNICEKCGIPFFWNVKEMWNSKTFGVRQHHCRKCGRALCADCSSTTSSFPRMGFEKPVRMCQDCQATITTDDRVPMAMFMEIKPAAVCMDLIQSQGLLVTALQDKTIKFWEVKQTIS